MRSPPRVTDSYREDHTYDDNAPPETGTQEHAPRHLYYDSSHHYPHHSLHHHQHHQHQHQLQATDPVWGPVAAPYLDAYHHHHLHIDATDYLLHHPHAATAVPMDDIMSPHPHPDPPHPMVHTAVTDTNPTSVVPAVSSCPARRSPKVAKKSSKKAGNIAAKDAAGDSAGDAAAATTYVLRIHEMLEDAEKERQTHIVGWLPHGRAFRIHNEELFVAHIMPRYFKAKLGSFQRWLRAWGFCRMTEGRDRGAWYHRHFVRGVTSFCKGLSRQQMAHSMVQWPPAGQVPNFYSAASESMLSEQHVSSLPEERDALDALEAGDGNSSQTLLALAKNPRRLRGTILEDLRQMLDDAEKQGHTHIVGWMPHGRAFKIHENELFQGLMPRYFRTAHVTHLSDTLRLWGFRRLKKSGKDKGCYFHRFFVRGDPSQSRHLRREQMKASMNDWPPPEGEPDLYHIIVSPPSINHAMEILPGSKTTGLDSIQASEEHFIVGGAPPEGYPTNHDLAFPGLPPVERNIPQQDLDSLTATKEETTGFSHSEGTYVLRLYEMLEDAEKEGNQHIVSWQPHGRAFRIHKGDEFVEKIMPRYFKANKKSFLRWCRAWGFVRMTEGSDRGAWYHRYFVRGVMSHSRSMSRHQMYKAMEDWLPPGYVPNFYESGSGSILSETNEKPFKAAPNVTCTNVRRLRGTVPEDLRQMLEEAEVEGNTQIVSWLPHGRAFAVFDKAAFTDHILPRYFKASKYTYFSDALRIWGWQRIKKGRDRGAYYHKLFVRGQPQLTRHLTRIQMKNAMNVWPPAVCEPNLYAPMQDNSESQQYEESSPGAETSTASATVPLLYSAVVPRPVETARHDCYVDNDGPAAEENKVWL